MTKVNNDVGWTDRTLTSPHQVKVGDRVVIHEYRRGATSAVVLAHLYGGNVEVRTDDGRKPIISFHNLTLT